MNERDRTRPSGEGKDRCSCPFCDAPMEKIYPFCTDCGKAINYCTKCGKPVPPHQETCPDCKD